MSENCTQINFRLKYANFKHNFSAVQFTIIIKAQMNCDIMLYIGTRVLYAVPKEALS